MSAGKFEPSLYEMDAASGGLIINIKVQPETLAATDGTAANAAPAGPADMDLTAKVSKTNREYGVKPRTVTCRYDDGQIPTDYDGDTFILPVLQPTTYAAWTKGTAITYLGATAKVVSRSPEQVS